LIGSDAVVIFEKDSNAVFVAMIFYVINLK